MHASYSEVVVNVGRYALNFPHNSLMLWFLAINVQLSAYDINSSPCLTRLSILNSTNDWLVVYDPPFDSL